jgi:Short C-terminal domain
MMTMGLIRGALRLTTGGAVSAKSKKQRMAAMQLAALQGRSQAEIKAAGGRGFDFENEANLRAKQQRERRRTAVERQRQRETDQQRQQNQAGRAAQNDAVSELERLAALHQSGALDDDEFRAAKARIIGTDGTDLSTPEP